MCLFLTTEIYCLVRAVLQCMYLIVVMFTWQMFNYTAWLRAHVQVLMHWADLYKDAFNCRSN